ncbi:MAG: serine/threonine-protein kinase [Gemmatimonadota bacterium]
MSTELERLQAALPKRYTLLREIDRGGTSRVYLAREELPERDVVIKVLDDALTADLGRDRFVREVEVAARLQHPHVVPVHAAGEADGTLYYVTPFLEGESLRDRIDRDGPLPTEESVQIIGQVAGVLQHAHERGVVHRDIKASKIFLQSGHAVVTDFGIASALGADDGDEDTDVRGLAAVVVEMLTGAPLDRLDGNESPGDLPSVLGRVVDRALSTAPEDRFRSVGDFASAVARAAQPAPPPPPPPPTSTAPFPLGRYLVAALTTVALLAASMWWFSDSRGQTADDAYVASVAVMPFENRTGDPGHEVLGRSLADEVIDRLASVPEIRVIDAYTTASLMNDSLGTPALLDTLDVEHIIHGYIESRDGELIVNVSKSTLGGFLSPRRQHRVDPEDLSVSQSQLANTVARSFLVDVELENRFDPGGTVIGPGREAYLAGNEALGQRTPVAMREAIEHFREAIALEPTSAPALSALSSAYALSLYYKYDVGVPGYELAARALLAADSAISSDPGVANGYAARGYARALLGMQIDSAEADFARAEAIAPNAPNGPSWSARILAQRGRIDEAFAEAARARDLDPLQAGRRTALASLGFQLGRYDVTIEESREAYRLEEQLTLAMAFEGRALALTGQGAECLTIDFGVYDFVRALCLHQLGRTDEAGALIAEASDRIDGAFLGDRPYRPEVVAQDVASYFGWTGDVDRAIEWLRFAFDLSPAGIDTRILGSELFAPVEADARFQAAVAQVQTEALDRVRSTRANLRPPL